MAKSITLHKIHNQATGHEHHFARNAAVSACDEGPDLKNALSIHRAANRAKHSWTSTLWSDIELEDENKIVSPPRAAADELYTDAGCSIPIKESQAPNPTAQTVVNDSALQIPSVALIDLAPVWQKLDTLNDHLALSKDIEKRVTSLDARMSDIWTVLEAFRGIVLDMPNAAALQVSSALSAEFHTTREVVLKSGAVLAEGITSLNCSVASLHVASEHAVPELVKSELKVSALEVPNVKEPDSKESLASELAVPEMVKSDLIVSALEVPSAQGPDPWLTSKEALLSEPDLLEAEKNFEAFLQLRKAQTDKNLNVCAVAKSELLDPAATMTVKQVVAPFNGAAVLVHGLQNALYNQRYGTCVGFDDTSERYKISFWHDLPTILIRGINLTVNAPCVRCGACLGGRTSCSGCKYGEIDGRTDSLPRKAAPAVSTQPSRSASSSSSLPRPSCSAFQNVAASSEFRPTRSCAPVQ